jgi:signal transduction histidine kinase/ActR/RegA family two-component response regulator
MASETASKSKAASTLPTSITASLMSARISPRQVVARPLSDRADAERLSELLVGPTDTLTPAYIARLIVLQGTSAMRAQAGTVLRFQPERRTLTVLHAEGYSGEAMARFQDRGPDDSSPAQEVFRSRTPIFVESPESFASRYPELAARVEALQSPAFACLPLVAGPTDLGVLVLSFEEVRRFSGYERAFMQALANLGAMALERAEFHDQERLARRRANYLARASHMLSSSLEYERTLGEIAHLAVPELADWVAVEMVGEDTENRLAVVAHADPDKLSLAHRLRQRFVPGEPVVRDLHRVLVTGRSELYTEITDSQVAARARDDEERGLLLELGLKSLMIVPIAARGRIVGAITFGSTSERRRYRHEDLVFAEQLGHRVGMAVDNANLYAAAQAQALRASALAELGRQAISSPTGETMTQAVELVARHLDVGLALVLERTGGGHDLIVRSSHGVAGGQPADRTSIAWGPETQAGCTVITQKTIMADDPDGVPTRFALPEPLQRQGVKAGITVVIPGPEGPFGVLAAHSSRRRRFVREDAQFLESIATILAASMSRQRAEDARTAYERELEEAARHKDDFLAMLGHELRNPLTAIQSAMDLQKLCGDGDTKRLTHTRTVMDRQVRHMARLIDDLLDVSRIVRRKIELRREVVDLTEVVRGVITDFHEPARARDVTLVMEPRDVKGLWVHGDRVRLAQIAGNLVNNALKFTNPGGHVTVTLSADETSIHLTVSDNGIGMEATVLQQIFEPFRQADNSLGRTGGGLGLGLSVVRGLADLHGGSVHAESAGPGHGSTLRVALPVARAPDQVPAPMAGLQFPVERRRVLIVEDNEDTADTLGDVLRIAGLDVMVAHNGEEALAITRDFGPEVILCDIGLPGALSGYDVARAIRHDPSLGHPTMVAVTGYGRPEDRAHATEAGFDAHLTKPVGLDSIRTIMQAIRSGAPGQGS